MEYFSISLIYLLKKYFLLFPLKSFFDQINPISRTYIKLNNYKRRLSFLLKDVDGLTGLKKIKLKGGESQRTQFLIYFSNSIFVTN